jgi:hypothetical protein
MSLVEKKTGVATQAVATTSSSSNSVTQGNTVTTKNSTYRLPLEATLQNVTKLSIVEDKPVMFDYWTDSLDKKALIGVRETGEKLLVKSAEEYTSPISKFYKSMTEYIIITENSIYVVSSDIPTRKIS